MRGRGARATVLSVCSTRKQGRRPQLVVVWRQCPFSWVPRTVEERVLHKPTSTSCTRAPHEDDTQRAAHTFSGEEEGRARKHGSEKQQRRRICARAAEDEECVRIVSQRRQRELSWIKNDMSQLPELEEWPKLWAPAKAPCTSAKKGSFCEVPGRVPPHQIRNPSTSKGTSRTDSKERQTSQHLEEGLKDVAGALVAEGYASERCCPQSKRARAQLDQLRTVVSRAFGAPLALSCSIQVEYASIHLYLAHSFVRSLVRPFSSASSRCYLSPRSSRMNQGEEKEKPGWRLARLRKGHLRWNMPRG